jgi:hypothetical protein
MRNIPAKLDNTGSRILGKFWYNLRSAGENGLEHTHIRTAHPTYAEHPFPIMATFLPEKSTL